MLVSGADLASTLSFLLLGLLVLAAIIWVVISRSRRRGSKTIALDLALTLSGWWLMLAALGAVFVVVRVATGGSLELDASALTVPWPSDLPCDAGAGSDAGSDAAALSCSSMHPAYLSVENASPGIRVLGVVAQVLQQALWAVPAAMIAIISFHTLRGRAFGRTVVRSLIGGAIAVAALGVLASVLSGVTATIALREVFAESSDWYPQTFQLGFTPVPLLGALGLVALAAVFREGMRLQREKERLEKDTEGLV